VARAIPQLRPNTQIFFRQKKPRPHPRPRMLAQATRYCLAWPDGLASRSRLGLAARLDHLSISQLTDSHRPRAPTARRPHPAGLPPPAKPPPRVPDPPQPRPRRPGASYFALCCALPASRHRPRLSPKLPLKSVLKMDRNKRGKKKTTQKGILTYCVIYNKGSI
jgi:hypothetical protein